MSKTILAIDISKNTKGFIDALQLIHADIISSVNSVTRKVNIWNDVCLYVYCSNEQAVSLEKIKINNKKTSNTWEWLKIINISDASMQGMNEIVESVKNKRVDGCVTCGDLNEFFNIAKARVAPLKMIKNPILVDILPGVNGLKMIADISGYVFEPLRENAGIIGVLSGVYAKVMFDLKEINIGLLRTGYDNKKGATTVKDTIDNLGKALGKCHCMRFVGTIDADSILSADNHAHVVVTDGVTGMIINKYTRGLSGLFVNTLNRVRLFSLGNKIAWWFGERIFNAFKTKMNIEYGSLILGLHGVFVKADEYAGANGLYNVLVNAVKMCKARAAIYDELEKSLAEFDLAAQSVWSLYANTTKMRKTSK